MQENLEIHTSSPEDMVFEFLEMSRRLLSLIEHENKIMEECGCLNIETYLLHRDALLKNYEEKAVSLMGCLESQQSSEGIGELMMEEIISLKQALNDNTHHKFKSLKRSLSDKQGDAAWH
ncbi:MAG: hypothetical protein PHX61_08880 [Alphaproteobacteria bacterium]|nr:hypothetical protein [Alphaproteobacteria bacterium]